MKLFHLAFIAVLFSVAAQSAAGEESIRYAIFPAPPFMIGAEKNAGTVSGIDVEIVMEIARRMNLSVSFVRAPWVRCLELMKDGSADMLSSVYKRPDREMYMLYFDQNYLDRLPVAFYSVKGKNIRIQKYEDIYSLANVGVLRGAGYFDRFDKDSRVKKFDVASQDFLFPMLLAGRFDAFAGYVPTENYRINEEGYRGKVEKSQYEYHDPVLVYMTLSKKSILISKQAEFNTVNRQLIKEGFISRIIQKYYDRDK